MQARRPTGVSPLAIVLPHPPLPRRCSSLLSTSSSSPHTPRSCGSPTCSSLFFSNPKRKSTDSWNSSNGPDELDWEWKPEETLLLTRTLDALPAHLLTPFIGPVPPSNLLDKIARGVSQAKGPVEWPHSIRATRAKLYELARAKAKEEALSFSPKVITEEGESDGMHEVDILQQTTNIERKRPLYRQSSMDFMNAELKDNERLSSHLGRTDRLHSASAYHPYHRPLWTRNRSTSPPHSGTVPSLIGPSTPSSSTLNSLSSISASVPRVRPLSFRRSMSTMSSISTTSSSSSQMRGILPDPRIQRVKQSESVCRSPIVSLIHSPPSTPHTPPPSSPLLASPATPHRSSTKRAPSFGVLAQERREQNKLSGAFGFIGDLQSRSAYPSSDEEEKNRSRQAKKARTKNGTTTVIGTTSSPSTPKINVATNSGPPSVTSNGVSSPSLGSVPKSPRKSKKPTCMECKSPSSQPITPMNGGSEAKTNKTVTREFLGATSKAKPMKKPMNVQRNPSILGAELPHVQPLTPLSSHTQSQAHGNGHRTSHKRSHSGSSGCSQTKMSLLPSPSMSNDVTTYLPYDAPPRPPAQPSTTQKVLRTLRRVRRLPPARRISFGSLKPKEGDGLEGDVDGEGDEKLGSAFQLK